VENKFLYADKLINASSDALAGFNRRILGETYIEACRNGAANGSLIAGWDKADDMIMEGKIFYINPFPHHPCNVSGFLYGGSWVCNSCGRSGLERDWWIIRVFKDGNEWMCLGENFVNIMESANYAFGKTKEDAIKKYGELMTNRENVSFSQEEKG
jgi:hypothetical protein